MNLKNGKVFTSKFVGTGASSYIKKKNLPGRGLTEVEKHCFRMTMFSVQEYTMVVWWMKTEQGHKKRAAYWVLS